MSKMQKIIKAALFTPMHSGPKFTGRWGLPVAFVGGPGTGKTTITAQVAEAFSMWTEILAVGERGEGAFGSVPVPENGTLTYPQPDWALQGVKLDADGTIDPAGEAGVVIIDEMNTAGPHLQPALLGLALDGRIGGTQLPGRVRRIALMNETEDAASGFELAPPLLNRFGWYSWEASPELDWSAYWIGGSEATTEQLDATEEEARVMQAWPTVWADSIGKVTAFVQRTANMLEETKVEPGRRAFATRRSVAALMHALTSAQIQNLDSDETKAFCEGFVGEAWWLAFKTFCDSLMGMPAPVDVLDGKVKFVHDKTRLDLTFAFLSSASALVIGDTSKVTQKKRAQTLWQILSEVMPQGKDLGFDAAWGLSRAGLGLDCKAAITVCSTLEDYRKAIALNTKKGRK
jgi:hypothetical protein